MKKNIKNYLKNFSSDFFKREKIIFIVIVIVFFFCLGLAGRFAVKKLAAPQITLRPEIQVTLPEGLNILEVEKRLVETGLNGVENLSGLKVGSFKDFYGFLKDAPVGASLEGFLFPDTYRFWPESSATSAAGKFLDNFGRKFLPAFEEEIQDKKIYDIVIIASLIEREVRIDEHRVLVSGILWKRLELGIALQVDATLCYIKFQKGQNCLPITNEDKKDNSRYNTYKYAGLPAGPIANPGFSAIKAAIFPKSSSYLYYLSTPDGETIFSETLEKHNVAKRKHLK